MQNYFWGLGEVVAEKQLDNSGCKQPNHHDVFEKIGRHGHAVFEMEYQLIETFHFFINQTDQSDIKMGKQ
ncbi:hypothetical protein [Lunatibacter salilacus]|uniref:hypothetical protein n=1 Tax=Lunatibacter salilacus TaxID=2483804 RepID=UPI00131B3057|nr:hypothetical protein [Lunatibacter salilacus]